MNKVEKVSWWVAGAGVGTVLLSYFVGTEALNHLPHEGSVSEYLSGHGINGDWPQGHFGAGEVVNLTHLTAFLGIVMAMGGLRMGFLERSHRTAPGK